MRRLSGLARVVISTMMLFTASVAWAVPIDQKLPMTFSTNGLAPESSYYFTFRLFDAASGGNLVWSETSPVKLKVSGSKAISWKLGSVKPIGGGAVDFSQQLWAEASGGGKTFSRIKLTMSPYALWSPNASPGLSCWDLNASGACDPTEEDVTGDGYCDALDCRGTQGEQGPVGAVGPSGEHGLPGQKGDRGDVGPRGADGPVGPVGAQGPSGLPGPKGDQGDSGPQGLVGPQGLSGPQGIQGVPGSTGARGLTGLDGTDGVNCWDLNADGGCDLATEDIDLSGACDAIDCRGPAGPKGESGSSIIAGTRCPAGQYVVGFDASGHLICESLSAQPSPILVQDGLKGPEALVYSDGYIFFADNTDKVSVSDTYSTLFRLDPATGELVALLENAVRPEGAYYGGIHQVVVDTTHVYAGYGTYTHYSIARVPKAGGTAEALVPENQGGVLLGIIAGEIYFGIGFSDIMKMSAEGGSPTTVVSGNWARSSVFDPSAIYFVEYNTRNIRRLNADPVSLVDLVTGNPSESGVFINSSHLFQNIGGSIKVLPKSGGTPATLVASDRAGGIIADDSFIYFCEDGRIKRIPVSGGASKELASYEGQVTGMAIVNSYLFWAETDITADNGRIKKIALTP